MTIVVQINQIHIKWPGERQKIKEIDVNKSLVTPPISSTIQIKEAQGEEESSSLENGNYNNESAPFYT